MRVLVTGGAGYIGSHACKALASAGHEPIAYDNLIYGHVGAVKWGPLEHGDILDRDRLDTVFRIYRPEAVMHFAAFAYVGESVQDPAKYYRNNVAGALSLLESMLAAGVPKLVFSSSCATYGTPDSVPIGEEQRQLPVNPYGRSKLMIEQVLQDFGHAYGLLSIALRYFNAAGADPDGELGEEHDPETHLIPLILQVAAGRREHITIFGEDYDTPDGTCIRDYVHVSDLAHAHVLALEALASQDKTRAYNLGTGQGFSVRHVIRAASEITGRAIDVQVGPRREGDPPALIADAGRIRRDLGWHPRHSDLEVILGTAWQWMSRRSGPAKWRVAG